jgi:hypothetical protein
LRWPSIPVPLAPPEIYFNNLIIKRILIFLFMLPIGDA